MHESVTNEAEAFEHLRSANPFAADGSPAPQPTKSQTALFEETIMYDNAGGSSDRIRPNSPTRIHSASNRIAQPRLPQRGLIVRVAAIVAVLVTLGAVVGIATLGGAPSAYADYIAATERTADFDSGIITITVDARAAGGDFEPFQAVIDYRYEDDDYEVSWTIDGTDDPDAVDTTQLSVDGIIWQRTENEPRFRVQPGLGPDSMAAQFGFNPEAITPTALLPLLEASSDFAEITRIGETDGLRTFGGIVPTAALIEMTPTDIPAGLSLFADENPSTLPTDMEIEAIVRDNLLDILIVKLRGDTAEGPIDFTVTTTYGAFGEPQDLVAPTDFDQPVSDPAFSANISPDEAAAHEAYIAALEELHARRSDPCVHAAPRTSFETNTEEQKAEMRAVFENFMQCYVEAGEPQVAAAMRSTLPPFFYEAPAIFDTAEFQQAQENARVVFAELDDRRPGLCNEVSPIGKAYDGNGGQAEARADMEAYIACFDDAGEPAAAQSLRDTVLLAFSGE